jgi:aryl-alcohol dehydrogenase-like predicted oxidoreductase
MSALGQSRRSDRAPITSGLPPSTDILAKAHGCSPARLSIAWLLAKPVVTSVIIGAKRLDQLQDNLAAAELILTQDELRQLDEVSVLPPEYPGWVLPFQGADRLEPVDRWERFREAKKPH